MGGVTLDELYAFGVCQLSAKWRRMVCIVSGHKKPLFKIGDEVLNSRRSSARCCFGQRWQSYSNRTAGRAFVQ
jgi:hypothetical protein